MKIYNPSQDNSTDFFVNEPVAKYYSSKTSKMPAYFEKNMVFADVLKNKIALVSMIQAGLPYMLFDKIYSISPFSEQEWADYLNLSSKSLQRYKADGNHLFKPIHSEKIIEIAEVTLSGLSVFNDSKKFNQWLHSDCYALGGYKPVFLLSNSYGKEIVLDELNRIEHGIFA